MIRYPLTPLQQNMLLRAERAEKPSDYVDQVVCTLDESIDVARLQAAWQATLLRHPALRTGFRVQEFFEPVQEVEASATPRWIIEDWQQLAPAERDVRFSALARAQRRERFDLAHAPLTRLALVRWAAATWRLIWTFHHLLLDGRSVRSVLRDCFDAYDGAPMTPPSARSFEAYVREQPAADDAGSVAFWRAELAGFSAPTWIGDRVADRHDDDPAVRSALLPLQLGDTLRAIADQNHLTLNTLIQFAWAQVISCYSGATDVVFGATRAARGAATDGVGESVGLFINTVPVRARLDSSQTLRAWLQDLRARWVAMRRHERAPLASLQRAAALPPQTPLFSSLLVYEHESLQTALRRLRPDWQHRSFSHRSGTEYALTLAVFGEPELQLRLGYDGAQFSATRIATLLERLATVLSLLPDQLDRPVSAFQLLTDAECRHVLAAAGSQSESAPDDVGVAELFERQVARAPHAPALIAETEELSYATLNRRANRLAHELRAHGVGRDRVVGISLRRSTELVVAILATLKAGGAYLCLDPDYPAARVQHMVYATGVAVLISQPDSRPAELEADCVQLCLIEHADRIGSRPDTNLASAASAGDLAYVVYTSGSTGRPKGILIEQRGLTNFARSMAEVYRITPGDRRLQFVSISADVLIGDLFPYLISGAAVVLRPARGALGIGELLSLIVRRGVTVVGLPSSYWHEWMAAWSQGELAFPPSLRLVVCGTERVRPDLYAVWRDKAPRGVRWFNVYGPSETTGVATLYEADPDAAPPASSIPIGRPIANVRVYVLDPLLRLVPVGGVGELAIGGVGVGRGYLGQPAWTAERFVPDPFARTPGSRMYRTGDLGRLLPDGNLEFVGRLDQQLKIRGHRVEPGEIESVLAGHPDVRACAVAAAAGAAGEARLYGFVVPGAAGADPDTLRAYLATRVPDHMLPARIVLLAELPTTPGGKLDRSALDRHLPVQVPSAHVAPRTRLEVRLAAAWSHWFAREVGIDDDFFALGGDSLLAMKLFAWLDRELGVALPLSTLLQHGSVRRLAAVLGSRQALATPGTLVAIKASGTRPPLFSAHGMGNLLFLRDLAHALSPEQPLYGLEAAGLLPGELPHPTLEAMAAHYVRVIRSIQPSGPYRLAGQCFGGVLAYAMAQELVALGESVALLAILDSNAPHRQGVARPPRTTQRQPAWAGLRSWWVRKRRSPRARRIEEIAQHHRNLRAAYRALPYPGAILLVRSSEFARWAAKDHQRDDWRALALGGLDIQVIEARHATLLSPPAVAHTARVLELHLRDPAPGMSAADRLLARGLSSA